MSWKISIEGASNGLRFYTKKECELYCSDLWIRWTSCPTKPEAVEFDDPATDWLDHNGKAHTFNKQVLISCSFNRARGYRTPCDEDWAHRLGALNEKWVWVTYTFPASYTGRPLDDFENSISIPALFVHKVRRSDAVPLHEWELNAWPDHEVIDDWQVWSSDDHNPEVNEYSREANPVSRRIRAAAEEETDDA